MYGRESLGDNAKRRAASFDATAGAGANVGGGRCRGVSEIARRSGLALSVDLLAEAAGIAGGRVVE